MLKYDFFITLLIQYYTHNLFLYFYIKDRDLYTPLHAAAAAGCLSCVHILIKSGADIEAKNVYGNTPLHIACLNGCSNVVTELMANGVNLGLLSFEFLIEIYCFLIFQ